MTSRSKPAKTTRATARSRQRRAPGKEFAAQQGQGDHGGPQPDRRLELCPAYAMNVEERTSCSLSTVLCVIPMGAFLIITAVMGWERFFLRRLAGAPVAVVGVAHFIGLAQISAGGSLRVGVAIVAGGKLILAVHIVCGRLRNLESFHGRLPETDFRHHQGHFPIGEPLHWAQAAGSGITLVGAWLVNRHPSAS
jgi:hypothetical protein